MLLTERKVVALPPRLGALSAPRSSASGRAAVYSLSPSQQARKAQDWLAMIVESSHDAIIGISLDGLILSWNHGAKRLFGYSTVKVMGLPVTTLFAAEGADAVQALIGRAVRGESSAAHDLETLRENGHRGCVSVTLSPIKNKSGAVVGVALIARDMAPRKRVEVAEPSHAVPSPQKARPPLYLVPAAGTAHPVS